MSVSAFNPAYPATTNSAPTANTATANSLPSADPTANYATDSYAAAPTANTAAPTSNGIDGLPVVDVPTANTSAPTANTGMPSANTGVPTSNGTDTYTPAPTANTQAPTANAQPAPAPVAVKSAGGGFLGSILAAAGGGLLALKGLVPKFFPTLLENASRLKLGGIFGIGALAGTLAFSLFKKFTGPKPDATQSAQSFPPEAIAQLQQLLQQGVTPQQLAQQGVPVEALRQAGAQV